jgi:hypothetical protein
MNGLSLAALGKTRCLRRGALLAAALLAIGCAGYAAGLAYEARANALLDKSRGEVQTLRDQVAALAPDGAALEQALGTFEGLRRQGFVGRVDAIALAEAIDATARARRLPPPSFEINALADEEGGEGGRLRAFAVTVTWSGLHEDELLAMLHELRQARVGDIRVRRCRLLRSAEAQGLQAECALRWSVFEPEVAS